MPHVPQELKEAYVSWEVGFTKAPKYPQVGLEQGEQTLRPILVYVTTCVFLLCMIDKRMVAYPLLADNVSSPLPNRLRRLTQPVMSPPHVFLTPRPPLLICT